MKHFVLRRVLSVLLCVSLLLGVSVVRPQKAEAFAISASVVASVIMIMTACGVTFWASTQGDAESYISQKLGEYFDTLQSAPSSALEWLGLDSASQLFTVLSGGFVSFRPSVANPILDFIRWFNSSEGVESGGSEVGLTGSLGSYTIVYNGAVGSISVEDLGGGVVRLTFAGVKSETENYAYPFVYFDRPDVENLTTTFVARSPRPPYPIFFGLTDGIVAPAGGNVYTAPSSINWQVSYYPLATYPYVGFGLKAAKSSGQAYDGYADFQLSSDELSFDREAVVTPSASVAVPDDLADDESFDVSPSVSLSEGMSVDDASSAIFDGVTSADGLTSSGEAAEPPAFDLSGVLEILGSILNAILAIPGHIASLPSAIASAFNSILSSIKSVLDTIKQTVIGIPQDIAQGAQDVITGIQSLPQLISDALVNLFVPDEAFIGEFVASLHGIFDNRFSILSYPFSILGEFITRASGIDEDEPILRWPDIYEPFSGQLLIGAGSYNLNQIRQGNFAQAHGLYMVVVKGWIAFEFLGYLYSWFCSVFKMREDDFVSPLEAYDGGDDG